MQLDLQSVVSVRLCEPIIDVKTLGIGLPRMGMNRSFLHIHPELFPALSRVQLQAITVSTFSIQLGEIPLQ